MVKDEHQLRHFKIKSCKNLAKARNRKVIREVSRTYVFFQGLSIVFQAYQGSSVKASSTRQDPASLLIPRRQLLKRLGLQGSGLPTQYRGKSSRAEGTRSEQQTLKNLPFHPVKDC